jgi:hypothetical protein
VQLSNLSSIKKISEGRNIAIYQLEVNDDKKLDETISEISRLIISSGGDLYSIYKKVVDLETLFREASEFSTNTDKMEA